MKELEMAFAIYERDINRVYEKMMLIKETYSFDEYEMFLEGFLNRMMGKAAAHVSNAYDKTVAAGKSAFVKGKEMGDKVLQIGKDLIDKLSNAVTVTVNAIKSAPGKLWDSVTSLYNTVSSEVSGILKSAKDNGAVFLTNAMETVKNIYDKVTSGLAAGISATIAWGNANKDEFKKNFLAKKAELTVLANSAIASGHGTLKKIGNVMLSALKGTLNIAENIAILAIGTVGVTVYGLFLVAKKGYEFGVSATKTTMQVGSDMVQKGKDGVIDMATKTKEWTDNALETIKNAAPNAWAEIKASYQDEKAKLATESNVITSFEQFVNERYNN